MFTRVLFLTALLSIVSAYNVQGEVIYSTWVGGSQGQWANASNWTPAIVPDNTSWRTFVVTIDSNSIGVDRIVVGLEHDRTIDQIDCYGKVSLACRVQDWLELTLADPNGLTNHGQTEIPDWNLGITGNVTNEVGAKLNLHPRSLDIRGLLVNKKNATIVTLNSTWVESNNLENAGTIIVRTSRSILGVVGSFFNTGSIQLFGGGSGSIHLFDNDANGVITGFGILFSEELIDNRGEIYAYGGSLAVSSEGPLLNSGVLANYPLSSLHIKPATDVNNLGTIEVHAGGGVTFDCNLINEPDAAIKLLGGTLAAATITQSANATFEGFGGITGNIIIEPNGIIRLTGPTNIVGDVIISPQATLEINDSTTIITGHVTCNGTIHLKGGRVIPQSGLSGNCNIIREPSVSTNIVDFNLDGYIDLKDFADLAITWLRQAG
jgi:hypothetical protein